ncbi:MAG: hypothetical protein ACI8QD_001518 [Cyclobacteriaceae bacterium]|jgi:hypothetical protein
MKTDELQKLWMQIDQTADDNLAKSLMQQVQLERSQSKMNQLVIIKTLNLLIAGGTSIALSSYAFDRFTQLPQFVAGTLLAIWMLAISIATIRELVLILHIDYSDPISLLQKKLIEIKLTSIKYLRLSVWILPFSFAFVVLFFDLIWGLDIVAAGDRNWMISYFALTVIVFVPAAIWMHTKLAPKNASKKWMNNLLQGNGSQIEEALLRLQRIEAFEK